MISGLLHFHQIYNSEDRITGNYNGVLFRCADVLQKKRDKNQTSDEAFFQGRFYEFYFPKEFKKNLLIIQPDQFRPFQGFKRTKLESIEFNSRLKVYSKDEHETFYILTPHFMEKLIYLDKKYKGKIGFSFQYNRLYLAIDTETDSFDIEKFKEFDTTIFKKIRDELIEIRDIMNALNFDQTLFKK